MATEVVQGMDDLKKKLAALPPKVIGKLERKGTRDGTKLFADGIRLAVPVLTGLLRGALTVRALKRKRGRVGYRVTLNTKKGGRTKAAKEKADAGGFFSTSKKGRTYFYPAIIEYGSKKHQALAPMRRSFDDKRDAALKKVITSIREGIRDATGK